MKKIFYSLVAILVTISLYGCIEAEVDYLVNAYNDLTIQGDLNNIVDDVNLTTSIDEVLITWSSSNDLVITTLGEVNRQDTDTTVVLTAQLEYQEVTKEKEFTLKVIAKATESPNPDGEPESNDDQQTVDQALATFELTGDLTNVTTNLNLVFSIEDITVSYESSNESVLSNTGVVTQVFQDEIVTLIATLTLNDVQETKTFVLTVKSLSLSTLEEVINMGVNQRINVKEVIVVAKTTYGFYVTDNTNVIYVFGYKDVLINDKINLSGITQEYNGLKQIKDVTVTNVGTEESSLNKTSITVEELANSTIDDNVYGYLQLTGIYENGVLNGHNNTTVAIGSYSLYSDSLNDFVGKKVQINVFVQWISNDTWEVILVDQTPLELQLNDLDILDSIKNKLLFDEIVVNDLELLTSLDTATISWESSNEDVLSNTGVIVRGEENVTVTLIATITLNGQSVTKQFNLIIKQTDLTDDKILETVKNELTIDGDLNNVTTDIKLTYSAYENKVQIVWTSSNTNVVDNYGNIVRQDEDITVTLTATMTINQLTDTKEFIVIIKAIETMTIKEVLESNDDTNVVVRNIIVVSISKDGYYITDNTDIIFVYVGYSSITVQVNDKGLVEGTRATYNNLKQIKNATFTTVSTEVATLTATSISMEDYYSSDMNGYYAITGTLISSTVLEYNGLTIELSSNSLSLDLLTTYIGKTITINLYSHIYKSSIAYFYFNGTTLDISERELSDEEKVQATILELSINERLFENIDLPLTNETYSTTISWESSNQVALSNTGVVTRQAEDTDVVLTVTVSLNDIVGKKDFNVLVIGQNAPEETALTVDFRINKNMGTEYTVSTFSFFNSTPFSLTSISSTWGGVNGGVDGGLKFGSGSKNGSFTVESSDVVISKVVVTAKYYDSASKLVVNGTSQILTDSFVEYEFIINSNTLTIGSDVKRVWVEQVVIYYS